MAPNGVWESEMKRSWSFIEAGIMIRASALDAHLLMRARKKGSKEAIKAQKAKARASKADTASSSDSLSDLMPSIRI